MPIEYDSNNPRLIPSVVSFIDVLGFSQLGMRAINNGEGDVFLNQIHTSLNKARHAITNQLLLAKVKVFTDNVVIGWPIYGDGEGELGTTFLNLAEYQFSLVFDGFFIRGGVSVGPHFMDEETVFGPELITAYNLESQVAVYPRIILSGKSIEKVHTYKSYYPSKYDNPFYFELLEDMDGEWFINYLYVLFDWYEEEARNGDFTPFFPHLETHRNRIESALDTYVNNHKLLKKYAWIANYHNYFCDEFVPDAPIDLKVDSPIKMSPPRRIFT
ncbi:hypothetical protein COL26_15375 [Bacillus thuringiensis]|uniref:Guanylate cyclase domain-containing protein n=2 Tax=Bacillus cereus group TaxID=86661 RepID=A0ABD6S8F8_BACTU|nr:MULTISPECIES: hypothetical protein [Bacillus cereus group]MDA2550220.1 hypothetical protein [Bacillus cereus]MDA2555913.1 hypothetical protein [Bacillus cereus]PEQ87853.1 hypothetical protein CN475_12160 [Bacillus cereus]PER56463.1 hypothetical protein CN495_06190 [Bacillus thuringiensis]PEU75447.1 hypothetical protein CN411_30540 [Bacillus thuringiensis]